MARKKVKLPDAVAAAVPLSSMIDVVFLLLIYFILTQKPVVEDVHMPLDLPAPGSASQSDEPPPTMLRVDVVRTDQNEEKNKEKLEAAIKALESSKDPNKSAKIKELQHKMLEGTYYRLNSTGDATGDSVSYFGLKRTLQMLVERDAEMIKNGLRKKGTTVIINCGPNAKHEKLILLLDLCEELNKYSADKLGVEGALRQLNLVHDATVAPIP